MGDAAGRVNRLAGESSPYLLQHARNPVDWWPWGRAAFEEARRRGVPILLSVGYSTCYWCHVMERESFEDEATARVMNERFVCVKLDREERPDVDDIYMNALLLTRGTGGWPMNVFLEPQKLRPLWCGTYFPPRPAMNLPSWTQILEGVSDAWTTRRGEMEKQGEEIAAAVRENLTEVADVAAVGEGQIGGALQQLLATFDRVNGGFGGAPKFPQPAYAEFLLDVMDVAGDDSTRDAVELCLRKTLDSMLSGGIYDQLGGGFHRYSVDASWTVPHFEKMLYDNAQLASVYARAARALGGEGEYERAARGTLDYVMREMRGDSGEFFSAQDAEVEGREGKNYVWSREEVEAALGGKGSAEAELAARVYGLDRGANFRDPHHPESPAVNVLRLEDRLDRIAGKVGMEIGALRERLGEIGSKLMDVRATRVQPGLDDKVLAGWNGLMMQGMALGARELGEERYARAARACAGFVLERMVTAEGTLLRSWRKGTAGPKGVLQDSAMVIQGLIDVELLGGGERSGYWLAAAERLAEKAVDAFKEVTDGRVRWCDTREGEEDLFVRSSSIHDGVMPSGCSAMLEALVSLAKVTGKARWKSEAREMMVSMSGAIARSPVGCIHATRSLVRVLRDAEMRGWIEALERAAPAATQASPDATAATHGGELKVEVYAAVDRVAVREGEPAEFRIVLKVAEGYHVLAAEPGPGGEGLVPLRVGIVHGSGVVAYADYPEGELYREGLRVYRGTLEFAVVLERVGAWKGRPLVALTYQACTDTECMLPVTVELDVAVDADGKG